MNIGDLVRQAPNIFADRHIGGQPMMVINRWVSHSGNVTFEVMFESRLITFHAGELEPFHPRR